MKLMIWNCRRDELTRERLGFHSALERCANVIVCPVRRVTPTHVEMAVGSSVPISEVEALWHLDPPETLIPEGLPSVKLLTLWVHRMRPRPCPGERCGRSFSTSPVFQVGMVGATSHGVLIALSHSPTPRAGNVLPMKAGPATSISVG